MHSIDSMRLVLLLVSVLAAAVAGCDDGKRAARKAPPPPPAESLPALRATDGTREWKVTDKNMMLRVQARLQDLGIYLGPVDGSYRKAVEDALGQFQAARGVKATGVIDAETADALGLPPSVVKPPAETATKPGEARPAETNEDTVAGAPRTVQPATPPATPTPPPPTDGSRLPPPRTFPPVAQAPAPSAVDAPPPASPPPPPEAYVSPPSAAVPLAPAPGTQAPETGTPKPGI